MSDPLDRLTPDFMAGYLSGYMAGIDRGRELAETELADLQRRAAEVAHRMARLAPWPEQEKRARRARLDEVRRFREDHQRRRSA